MFGTKRTLAKGPLFNLFGAKDEYLRNLDTMPPYEFIVGFCNVIAEES